MSLRRRLRVFAVNIDRIEVRVLPFCFRWSDSIKLRLRWSLLVDAVYFSVIEVRFALFSF